MNNKKPGPVKAEDYGKDAAITPDKTGNDTANTDGKKTLSLWSSEES